MANESREDNQMLVAKTLLTVREGDLLSLTVTPGDGGGHLASGEDETREIWMTVTKISTSTGGRRQLEGESNGLRVQLIDQGRGLQGARLGVAGPVLAKGSLAPKDRWIEALPGWSRVLTRPADLERGVLSSVTRVAVVASLDRLEQALESDHRPWTTGASSPMRRAVIVDPVEAATQTAGELLALLRGKRDVALCQLHAGWLPPDKQPVLKSPWALTMLKRCVEDPEIEFEMSVSDDVEAHAGISVALYRRDAPGAGEPIVAINFPAPPACDGMHIVQPCAPTAARFVLFLIVNGYNPNSHDGPNIDVSKLQVFGTPVPELECEAAVDSNVASSALPTTMVA